MTEWAGNVERRPKGVVFFIAAAVTAVLVGVIALNVAGGSDRTSIPVESASTTSDPTEATATVTTAVPSSVTEVADPLPVASQLLWRQVGSLPTPRPTALLDLGETMVLFGPIGSGTRGAIDQGLQGWRSTSGRTWELLGTFVPAPHIVEVVVQTDTGFIAIGSNGVTRRPGVWRSGDGPLWTALALPEAVPAIPQLATGFVTAASGGRVAVFGRVRVDLLARVRPLLPDKLATGRSVDELTAFWVDSASEVRVSGPLGLVLFRASASELDLTPVELATLRSQARDPRTVVWTSSDAGRTWSVADFDVTTVDGVGSTADGSFLAVGSRRGEFLTWTSVLGREWQPLIADRELTQVVSSGGRIVASSSGVSGPTIQTTTSGINWSRVNLSALYPGAQFSRIEQMSVGAGLVGGLTTGFAAGIGPDPPPAALLAERDGYELRSDPWTHQIMLVKDGSELFRYSPLAGDTADGAVVDFEAQTVSFVEEATRDRLVTFEFGEIDRVDEMPVDSFGMTLRQGLFAFSDEGQWYFSDVAESFGHNVGDSRLLVSPRGIIAAVTAWTSRTSGPPPSETELWIAALGP